MLSVDIAFTGLHGTLDADFDHIHGSHSRAGASAILQRRVVAA
jgi:hypothetical protein